MMPTLVSESASIERERWTATDFLDWLQPGVHADLIDGEEFMHSPGSLKNARLTNFLDHLLRSWLERTTFGGELHREMVAVRLDSRNVFLPDLCWFDAEQKARLPETHAPLLHDGSVRCSVPERPTATPDRSFPPTKRPACANIGCSIPKPSRTGFTFDRSKANISKNSPAEKIGSLRAFSKDSAFPVSGFVRKPCKMFRLAWTQFHRDRHNAY
jgi:Putative restriction endonuclease